MTVEKGTKVVAKQELIVGDGLIVEVGLEGEVVEIKEGKGGLRDYVIVEVEGLSVHVPAEHFENLFDIIKEDIENA